MKKFFIILALVALVMLPVVAGNFAVGVEAGMPAGVTVDYQVSGKIDVYATGAFGYVGGTYIDAVIGGQYKLTTFSIKDANFDVLAGLQGGALFYLGNTNGVSLTARATATLAYNWNKFTAYLRGGIGAKYGLSGSDAKKFSLGWSAALGCVYHI